MGAWRCDRCGEIVHNTYSQVERRDEYRRVAGLKRMRTWVVERLCVTCAEADFERHDHPHGRIHAEQGAMW